MKCQFCNTTESKVLDSRPIENGMAIRRRRECLSCKRRFTTYERIELAPIYVIKKDNSREAYNSEKIKNGILRACEKRPISMLQINQIVTRIEHELYSNAENGEISSMFIGELVMRELKALDEVAYVRFASVYRQFTDISSFMDELTHLIRENKTDKD
ncbi:MAG: transcriptional repressor NrdR [Christensenellaceae bacterium]|nr:transcriptional repressor NrdR [Christensenellaceae bacterium]